jgi:hypothetical protein
MNILILKTTTCTCIFENNIDEEKKTLQKRYIEYTSLSPIRREFAPGFVNYKKGALDSQPQVIKITSCLPMAGIKNEHLDIKNYYMYMYF